IEDTRQNDLAGGIEHRVGAQREIVAEGDDRPTADAHIGADTAHAGNDQGAPLHDERIAVCACGHWKPQVRNSLVKTSSRLSGVFRSMYLIMRSCVSAIFSLVMDPSTLSSLARLRSRRISTSLRATSVSSCGWWFLSAATASAGLSSVSCRPRMVACTKSRATFGLALT